MTANRVTFGLAGFVGRFPVADAYGLPLNERRGNRPRYPTTGMQQKYGTVIVP
jgi:hypothetical protein